MTPRRTATAMLAALLICAGAACDDYDDNDDNSDATGTTMTTPPTTAHSPHTAATTSMINVEGTSLSVTRRGAASRCC
jgi:hypothetical protein